MTLPVLPALLDPFTANADCEQITMGWSGAAVFRLTMPDSQHFLKIAPPELLDDLRDEVARLRWLAGRLPIPEVLAYVEHNGQGILVSSAVPGRDIAELAEAGEGDATLLARLMAQGLRQFHSLPADDCPFLHTTDHEIATAQRHMLAGRVDLDDFDDERRDRPVADLFAELVASRPPDGPLVVTHGDPCCPNFIVAGNWLNGTIDLGRAGLGDPYRDLALAARSIAHNLGPAAVAPFFAEYGLPDPDQARLAFFRLLDEFF